MKVQKGILPDTDRPVWIVLDDNYLPIEPIQKYLHYLDSVGRSPNTIQTYAHNLKLFWEFLRDSKLDWLEISLEQLSNLIHWLRNPNPGVLSVQPQVSKRSEKTINHCLTTVCGFYEFQERIGATEEVNTYRYQLQPGRKYKPFLHHISKGKEVKTRLLKIKEPKTFPGCLTPEQVNTLVEACNTLRDKFLIRLLYETGLRIGEALGLRHEDMVTGNTSEIHVVPRLDNVNHVRAKSGVERTVHVSKELMQWYSAYLIDEYPEDIDCDFVFVVIKAPGKGEIGTPLTYKTVDSLFRRLSEKKSIKVNPHLLRHTHATELIRSGWDMTYVQKRLGHADIQTTINTYVHLTDFRQFLGLCARENWLEIPKKELIYDDDLPKWQKLKQPRYIPQKVLAQLNQHLDTLPSHMQRLLLILQECGMRIGEVCTMPFNCLVEGANKSLLLRFYLHKMKKEHIIPISDDLAEIIKIQQQYVIQEWGQGFPHLFPTPKPHGKGQPVSYITVLHRINKLAYDKNICDSTGNLWRFQLHQFRHTVGTNMINKGVPQHIIQRYLGHESPSMTSVYAHIHDETLRKEVEKYHESRIVNFQGETAELDETILSSNDDLEWFKKNVQARALEHGYCARPKVLGDCDIPGFDGCYNCPHWRTNKNFIPILKDTLERTNNVLEKAKNCGWQLQINKNIPIKENLEKVIQTLEADNDQ